LQHPIRPGVVGDVVDGKGQHVLVVVEAEE
jgi:hypothetical protein